MAVDHTKLVYLNIHCNMNQRRLYISPLNVVPTLIYPTSRYLDTYLNFSQRLSMFINIFLLLLGHIYAVQSKDAYHVDTLCPTKTQGHGAKP